MLEGGALWCFVCRSSADCLAAAAVYCCIFRRQLEVSDPLGTFHLWSGTACNCARFMDFSPRERMRKVVILDCRSTSFPTLVRSTCKLIKYRHRLPSQLVHCRLTRQNRLDRSDATSMITSNAVRLVKNQLLGSLIGIDLRPHACGVMQQSEPATQAIRQPYGMHRLARGMPTQICVCPCRSNLLARILTSSRRMMLTSQRFRS